MTVINLMQVLTRYCCSRSDAGSRVQVTAKEKIMRTVSLISLILAALAVSSIAAHAGSWCAHYRNGGNNCGFHSFEQCQAAVSGVGGFCTGG